MAGKKLKKGKSGNAAQYITRTQAVRKLQLRLSEFRRLCILKGVHPREPKKKPKGANKTYYHLKDINWLAHEPLLNTFRSIKAHDKKVRKARAKQNKELAKRLAALTPTYRLDHLVKERYPSFVDALRDLDDSLTMVHLFATLPAESKYDIPQRTVQLCRRLALEWQAYVVRSGALRRVFVSVKGYYFQAEILGQSVTWLVPHALSQVLPPDVDYKVMLTFLEFYNTLLQFVNFKLYHNLGAALPSLRVYPLFSQLRYPPVLDPRLEEAAAELAAIMKDIAGMEEEEPEEVDSEAGDEDDDDLPVLDSGTRRRRAAAAGPAPRRWRCWVRTTRTRMTTCRWVSDRAGGACGPGVDPSDEAAVCGSLFRGRVFFLGREVPREPLMLVIRAFGGVAAWDGDGSPHAETDEAVTHQIVDRPKQGHKFLSREYVQPQWVFDSANFRVLMPTDLYAPGTVPPPHLSPFVGEADEDGYTPDFAKTVRRLQDAANAARLRAAGLALKGADGSEFVGEGADGAAAADGEGAAGEDLAAAERQYASELAKEDEEAAMADIMMTRKARKMYNNMKQKEAAKQERVQQLESKKAKLAATGAAGPMGQVKPAAAGKAAAAKAAAPAKVAASGGKGAAAKGKEAPAPAKGKGTPAAKGKEAPAPAKGKGAAAAKEAPAKGGKDAAPAKRQRR
uniref:Pescadillo homolog n=1 Tax=Chlamydomonas reinhardtii TaxID=3055 RepID=PESC_CHLRE|nr:RecName: Full=Pescadillo homolog [Chlamydomonas reinhardtii]|eukprot:XP_001699264.1 ribosome biogenesis pescadillo-like protein [Chlamydomonas reinhardtii]